jgi:dolichyl-phosphate beta-glucosyltransferase
MQEDIFLSVVIPAYNEEKRLPATLQTIFEYLKVQKYSWEIIVVNDGSKDGTARVVSEAQDRITNLRLIDNKENHGKGYVVRQGLLEAKGKYRLFMDADNSTSVEHVEKMLPFFERGYDIVIGSRDVEGAVLNPPQPWIRQVVLGEGFKLLRKIIAGMWDLQDTQCGFKVFSAKVIEDILPRLRIDRWAFDVEILAVAERFGYKIKEIPVTWANDPNSKVKISGMVKMLFELLQIKWNLLRNVYKK